MDIWVDPVFPDYKHDYSGHTETAFVFLGYSPSFSATPVKTCTELTNVFALWFSLLRLLNQ